MSKVPLGDPVGLPKMKEAPKNGPVSTGTNYSSISSINSSSSVSRGRTGNEGVRWKPSVFDFKSERGGSVCPTCRGVGRIPKGELSPVDSGWLLNVWLCIIRSGRGTCCSHSV